MATITETFSNPTGAKLDYAFDSGLDSVPARNYYVSPDAEHPRRAREIDRLRAIAMGNRESAGVQKLRGQLDQGARQSYGLVQGAGMENAATRERLARGAKAATLRQAPQILEAATIDARQRAAGALASEESRRRALEEEKLQEFKRQELEGEIDKVQATGENREGEEAFKSSAVETAAKVIGMIFSDEKLKENIAPAGMETRRFIDSLAPKTFNYKGADPRDQRLGVLANDTPPGVVTNAGTREDPVLGFDNQKATSALLASVGQLGAENKNLRNALVDLDGKLNAMTGDKRGVLQEHERRFEPSDEWGVLKDFEKSQFRKPVSRDTSGGLGGAGIADPALHPLSTKARGDMRGAMQEWEMQPSGALQAFETEKMPVMGRIGIEEEANILAAQEDQMLEALQQGIMNSQRRKGY
mgnify:CR=1 FL=1|tara:strand:+ start:162 stop:1406 length:1245 start_codon:yes stop_codon:yes gene_type:complete